MPHQALLTQNFIKAISSTYDENSTYKKNRKNTPPQLFHLNEEDLSKQDR
jgi:hypothetical protein